MTDAKTAADYDKPFQVSSFPREISDTELAFLQRLHPDTPIQDLRQRLLDWYTKTMAKPWFKFRCVRDLFFLHTTVDRNLLYREALSRRSSGQWWVDIGCGFGQDTRLPVLDGWPASRMLATDIVPHLWYGGLDLYPNPANIQFQLVNILELETSAAEVLNPFRQCVAVISLNLVLHTLCKEDVTDMLSSCASLLAPCGIILGLCVGSPEPRPWTEWAPERWFILLLASSTHLPWRASSG
ncbi:hypothetical protein WJX74_009072 [Apatococcus lobatus]|uniref:Methyltransferase domain-containing protein n=1 Tax=Apatococcus lobatus TaxID=904363 RepID=A0AAW1SGY5_9CHLO